MVRGRKEEKNIRKSKDKNRKERRDGERKERVKKYQEK
jgi:hypothetical protein